MPANGRRDLIRRLKVNQTCTRASGLCTRHNSEDFLLQSTNLRSLWRVTPKRVPHLIAEFTYAWSTDFCATTTRKLSSSVDVRAIFSEFHTSRERERTCTTGMELRQKKRMLTWRRCETWSYLKIFHVQQNLLLYNFPQGNKEKGHQAGNSDTRVQM